MTHMKISFVGKNRKFWKLSFVQNFYMKSYLCCIYMWGMFYVLWTWFEIFMDISHVSVPFQTVKIVLEISHKTIESRLNGLNRLVFHTTHDVPNKAHFFGVRQEPSHVEFLFLNFRSHLMAVQIFHIDLPFILSASHFIFVGTKWTLINKQLEISMIYQWKFQWNDNWNKL